MCRSMRFEDRKPCASYVCSRSTDHCEHHYETMLVLRENIVQVKIENRSRNMQYDVDKKAYAEVLWYMETFQRSILDNSEDDQFWWLSERRTQERTAGVCKSLEIATGNVCSRKRDSGSYCSFHRLQHGIICGAYHVSDLVVEGVSSNTKAFMEYVLRREFDTIYGIVSDLGHRMRYGMLYRQMFQNPYPSENFNKIDPDFYSVGVKIQHFLDSKYITTLSCQMKNLD